MEIDIGIRPKDRRAVAGGLAVLLADTYTLYLKTHNYHWNVTGPLFGELHTLFQAHYTELWQAIDEVAERIRALGEPAPGSYREFSKLSRVKDEAGAPAAMDMIRNLVKGHETVIKTAREILPVAEKAGDQVTVDFVTGRLQAHEKTAWMLRSHLEG